MRIKSPAIAATATQLPHTPAQAPERGSVQAKTAEQKLGMLTPGQRAEFEAKARTLGLEAGSLAAQDADTAAQRIAAQNQLSARQAALGKEMQDQIMKEREQTIARLNALLKQMNDAHAREIARAQR